MGIPIPVAPYNPNDTSPSTVRRVLEELRSLFIVPSRWTQECWAQEYLEGTASECDPLSPKATCFCLTGGLCRVLGVDPFSLNTPYEDEPPSPLMIACLRLLAAQTIEPGGDRTRWATAPWENALGQCIEWNDPPERRWSDVTGLLDQTIAALPPTPIYEVFVGNLGRVYTGTAFDEAMRSFQDYGALSRYLSRERASGEAVTLMADGEIVDEYPNPQEA
jgi:hypothetical protein